MCLASACAAGPTGCAQYKERDNAFTGRILKVTVEVKPVGAAVKAEADSAHRTAAVKKALSD